jgi:hypothetical protein
MIPNLAAGVSAVWDRTEPIVGAQVLLSNIAALDASHTHSCGTNE